MPSAVVDEHGSLYVGYLDRRLDPSQRMLWTWIARSADGGRTFDEYQVSDVGWDPFATEAFKTAGDRFGLAATKHSLRAFFPDARTGSLDVYTDAPQLDLIASSAEISAATGGKVDFELAVGPNHSGETYWLLGSFATSPPIPLGNVTLELALDPLFFFTLQATNSAVLANSRATLDGEGRATVTLDTLGPIDPSLVDIDLYFATLISIADPTYATGPVRLTIVP